MPYKVDITELDSRAVSSGLIPLFSPLIIAVFLINTLNFKYTKYLFFIFSKLIYNLILRSSFRNRICSNLVDLCLTWGNIDSLQILPFFNFTSVQRIWGNQALLNYDFRVMHVLLSSKLTEIRLFNLKHAVTFEWKMKKYHNKAKKIIIMSLFLQPSVTSQRTSPGDSLDTNIQSTQTSTPINVSVLNMTQQDPQLPKRRGRPPDSPNTKALKEKPKNQKILALYHFNFFTPHLKLENSFLMTNMYY
ncbi:hypothetical protein BpHYR1_004190 [Brachionus plicatilis]|uniref:Uncharacterized protein n=1 Tax=Brachionus plicatilis TaxID=10195 RepID=A0A3M7SYA9_BRAPC|nr:hypothetical protein BpHYR1_004190 [Brachionus plicatilis]